MANDKRKDLIDLDNLDVAQDAVPSVEKENDVIGNAGGLATQAKGNQIDSIFDRYKKLLFLFDISGSMGEGMLPDEIEKMYHWSDVVLDQFLKALQNDVRKNFLNRYIGAWMKPTDAELDAEIEKQLIAMHFQIMRMEIDEDSYDEEDLEKDAKAVVDQLGIQEKANELFFLTYGMEPTTAGMDLKLYIIRQSLAQVYGIKLVPTGVQATSQRKIDVMQNAASQFVNERFSKCPDAIVMAYQFDDSPELITRDCTKDGLLKAIPHMHPRGGTNIFSAIATALGEFKRSPSALGSHHIVLITDAESSDGLDVEKDQLPKMKELGVVLDFIQIKGTSADQWGTEVYRQSADALRRICSATGGDYTEVNTPAEFTKKFLAAANRLLIPSKV